MNEKIQNEIRLFNRLLMSYNDFKQAHEISTYLLENKLYESYPAENRTLVIGLNMAAIVAYSRPFSSNRGALAQRRIPLDILDVLTEEEREVHDIVITDRNTMMAHSDADANDSFPLVLATGNSKIVVPMNASPYANPLLPEAMKVLSEMSLKLQEEVFDRRQKMEPNLIEHLPVKQAAGTEEA